MAAFGHPPVFVRREGQEVLDEALAGRGLAVVEPVILYAGASAALSRHDPRGFAAIRCARPLSRMREIWAEGGIGPERLAVMARSGRRRTYLLGRSADRPAAVAFVATDREVAMLHALEVHPSARRNGLGRGLVGAAASFAAEAGAATLALAVTEANAPARALYEGLGMVPVGRYHYRA
jgi:GNAT superfamily N-acetyltransferase